MARPIYRPNEEIYHTKFVRHLDTVGDGSGVDDANVNGSVTPVVFRLNSPAAGPAYHVERLIIHIGDSAMNTGAYGAVPALTNGVLVKVHNAAGTAILDLFANDAAKTLTDWTHVADGAVSVLDQGTGDEFFSATILFREMFGQPLLLLAGESLRITVRDDLTGLTHHHFVASGRTDQLRS